MTATKPAGWIGLHYFFFCSVTLLVGGGDLNDSVWSLIEFGIQSLS